ncbi:MAG: hypothetical protein OIF50_00490 [Flavobacteriaceae bacterium]|nr:hypothetical protein [Flavobacteriaceae bacterium]
MTSTIMASKNKTLHFRDNGFRLEHVFINGFTKEFVWVKGDLHVVFIEENDSLSCHVELSGKSEIFELLDLLSKIDSFKNYPIMESLVADQVWGNITKFEYEEILIQHEHQIVEFLNKSQKRGLGNLLRFWAS